MSSRVGEIENLLLFESSAWKGKEAKNDNGKSRDFLFKQGEEKKQLSVGGKGNLYENIYPAK